METVKGALFVVTEDNVIIVKRLFLQDRNRNVKQLSSENGNSVGRIELILYGHLSMKKVFWVPRLLTSEQKK